MVAAGVPRRLLFFTLALGFASGLPLALSAGTLQAWLTVEGVNLTTLGWLTVLGVPYTYKFAWAPALDRFQLGGKRGGRRRGWAPIDRIGLRDLPCLTHVGSGLGSGSAGGAEQVGDR